MSPSACRSAPSAQPAGASPIPACARPVASETSAAATRSARRFFSARCAARFAAGSDSSTSTYSDGSSTICAKITARAAASGRRAHHRCSVDGWPCRIDFSRADAVLIASSGNATSISFTSAWFHSWHAYEEGGPEVIPESPLRPEWSADGSMGGQSGLCVLRYPGRLLVPGDRAVNRRISPSISHRSASRKLASRIRRGRGERRGREAGSTIC